MYELFSNLIPGRSPRSKWRWEKPLSKAQLKYSTKRGVFGHVAHDETAFFGDCFQHLAALFVFRNRKPLFKQNEDISSCLRDEILANFRSQFSSLGQGFSDRHFERGEGPGDEVELFR